VDVEAPRSECGNVQTGGGDRVSTISLLGCSTSVALAMGTTDKEEEGPATLTTAVRTPLYPLNRWLGGPWHWFGCHRDEIDLMPLPGIKPWIVQIIV